MYVRHHALAKLFVKCGWDVLVLTRGAQKSRVILDNDGVKYFSVSGRVGGRIGKALDYLVYAPRYINKIIEKECFDAVLLASSSNGVLRLLKKKAKNNRILLLHDSVEWYSPEQFSRGEKAWEYRKKTYWMTKGINEDFSVIAISRFLHNYFREKGIKVCRIPAILDVVNTPCAKKTNPAKTVVTYAGTPGKKDYLSRVVDGFISVSDEGFHDFEFRIIGINESQLIAECGVTKASLERLSGLLNCKGRLSREEVLKELSESDFTILLRDENLRYAKAGFPTKVVESMATGTPVICNLTSDLAMYIRDMANGIVVESCSSEHIAGAIKRALLLNSSEKAMMSTQARISALESFDYRQYCDTLSEFLREN